MLSGQNIICKSCVLSYFDISVKHLALQFQIQLEAVTDVLVWAKVNEVNLKNKNKKYF